MWEKKRLFFQFQVIKTIAINRLKIGKFLHLDEMLN